VVVVVVVVVVSAFGIYIYTYYTILYYTMYIIVIYSTTSSETSFPSLGGNVTGAGRRRRWVTEKPVCSSRRGDRDGTQTNLLGVIGSSLRGRRWRGGCRVRSWFSLHPPSPTVPRRGLRNLRQRSVHRQTL